MRRLARIQQRPLAGCSPTVPAAAGPRAAASCQRHMHHRRPQQPPVGHLAKMACLQGGASSSSSSSSSSSRSCRLFGSTSAPRSWTKADGKTTTPATAEEQEAIARAEAYFDAQEAKAEAEAAGAEDGDANGDVAAWAAAAPADGPQLVLPGSYATAPRPDKIADVGYAPAESGEGLETVGGLQDWWEDDGHWDPAVAFRGFGPAQRVTDPAVLEVLAQRAVLEAVAVQQQQQQQQQQVRLTDAWRRGGPGALDAALGLRVDVDADGRVVGVQGDVAGVVAGLAPQAADAAAAAEEQADDDRVALPSADEARALLASSAGGSGSGSSSSWKAISLDADPALKFAVTKRILQLTGHLLADAHTATAATAGALLAVLVRPAKATKLADELAAAGADGLAGLPNVAVYGRRVTPIDKHKMAGRWKVIVQELAQRGLPVTGTGGHAKAVERKWATR